MNMAQAWKILNKDWAAIVRNLRSMPGFESRVLETERLLVEAKKTARQLMAANHPDKNPHDPVGSTKRFQRIKEALDTIEASTIAHRSKYETLKETLRKAREENEVIIKIVS